MGRLVDVDKFLERVKKDREHEIYMHSWTADMVLERLDSWYAPTVEAIPKDQYETRLKADLEAILKEISITIEEEREDCLKFSNCYEKFAIKAMAQRSQIVIKQKIDALKGVKDDDR